MPRRGRSKGKVIDMATKEAELSTQVNPWAILRKLARESGLTAEDVVQKLEERRQKEREGSR